MEASIAFGYSFIFFSFSFVYFLLLVCYADFVRPFIESKGAKVFDAFLSFALFVVYGILYSCAHVVAQRVVKHHLTYIKYKGYEKTPVHHQESYIFFIIYSFGSFLPLYSLCILLKACIFSHIPRWSGEFVYSWTVLIGIANLIYVLWNARTFRSNFFGFLTGDLCHRIDDPDASDDWRNGSCNLCYTTLPVITTIVTLSTLISVYIDGFVIWNAWGVGVILPTAVLQCCCYSCIWIPLLVGFNWTKEPRSHYVVNSIVHVFVCSCVFWPFLPSFVFLSLRISGLVPWIWVAAIPFLVMFCCCCVFSIGIACGLMISEAYD